MERMNDRFPHENFIELFFPFLKSQPRGFLVSLFPPYRDYIGIDLELVLCIGVEVVSIFRADLNPTEFDFLWIFGIVCNTGRFQQVIM